MTALLLTENFPPRIGGSSRWFWELYRRMPRSDVVIAAGSCLGDAAFDATHDLRVRRLPLSFRDASLRRPRGWLAYARAAAALRAVVRDQHVAALHCGKVWPEGWLALALGRPFACYAHGEELISNRSSRELTWMARRVLARAALVIANSSNTAGLLERVWGVDAGRIAVVHPGVDTSRFAPAARDEDVRRALGWAGRTVVLTVARLQRRKGHDVMIDAAVLLRPRWPHLLYAIVGDGEERQALTARVRAAGLDDCVRFHGAVDDAELVRRYQQCDLFVLPNRTHEGDLEGFGMVLLEAQACGRAVVAGDSGGTAEALRAGETGVLVDCTRPEPLAGAIEALLSDAARRDRMGAAGRRRACDEFDFARQPARILTTLGRALPR